LYSLERGGILWGRDKISSIDWYAVGANDLLATQAKDGSWGIQYKNGNDDRLVNTAYAILFLRRAVGWIPTGDGMGLRPIETED
jgi:hypothetical protein